ncbi:MAG: hypothetical protein H0T51_16310 [Pirellulales bacterium]|nr:hypothetical protein [Pirellulales bacterium]
MASDSDKHTIPVDGQIVRETEGAVRLRITFMVWIPKAAIDFFRYASGEASSDVRVGARITAIALPWKLARRKRLVDDEPVGGGA